jgi:hypothetical protein
LAGLDPRLTALVAEELLNLLHEVVQNVKGKVPIHVAVLFISDGC